MKDPIFRGARFGKLTVEGDSGQRKSGCVLWRCRCDCGGEILAPRSQLLAGRVTSCGCEPEPRSPKMWYEDLTGRRFGMLTVIRRAGRDAHRQMCWECRCDCGNTTTVRGTKLKSGHTRSCGCLRRDKSYRKQDLTGRRFGRLTVLHDLGGGTWHCKCDCGAETDVARASLVRGLTQSCGCLNREQSAKMHEHMHYRDNTCVERLRRIEKDDHFNKAGFRGLFLTDRGKYRVMISFQHVHYTLGYFDTYEEAVRARLEAEDSLHGGYLRALDAYTARAQRDPAWADENPFYYNVTRSGSRFLVSTNGV